MDLPRLDIAKLVGETVELSEELGRRKRDFAVYPEAPGVVYVVAKEGRTFCLRGCATEDIREFFLGLCDEDNRRAKEYAAFDGVVLDCVRFFRAELVEQAHIIVEEIMNRRFPLEEDALCNIGDPGLGWWMLVGETGFTLYFQAQGSPVDAHRLVKLGPIGDGEVASRRLRRLFEEIADVLDIVEFECSVRTLEFSCARGGEVLESLKGIFLEGHPPRGDWVEGIGTTLGYFLREIAALRRFWMGVEKDLG